MDQSSKNRRRYPRLFRNVRFLFYFLGQTREVYTVDISYNGAFIQTDVFPPLGSFIILEHYHLKKRNVTLGLVGKIRRIQTPYQSSPAVRGVGVEWVRCYCNQGFLPLKQFLERDLGYQPFDWDTHLTYEEYDRKIVYDFATNGLSPTSQELDAILGTRRRQRHSEVEPTAPGARPLPDPVGDTAEAAEEGSRRPTRPVLVVDAAITPPSGLRAGYAEDATVPPLAARPDATARFERADTVPPVASSRLLRTAPPAAEGTPEGPGPSPLPDPFGLDRAPGTSPSAAAPSPDAPTPVAGPAPEAATAPEAADDLHPVDVKVVFGVGNRMFYGVVRGVSEREILIETATGQAVNVSARIQVRMPLNAKTYRYMVVIYGRVTSFDERDEAIRTFRLRIESIDEFQNPGGFRFFLQTLSR
jgi:hypothetical protein